MKLPHLCVAAVAGLLAASGANAASVVTVKYSGVVSSGLDVTGEFGAPGASLAGATFTAGFAFYEGLEGHSSYTPPLGSTYDSGVFANFARARITINGRSLAIPCDFFGDACLLKLDQSSGRGGIWGISTNIGGFSVDDSIPEVWNEGLGLGITSATDQFVTNFDYHTRLTHLFAPGDVSQGHFTFTDYYLNEFDDVFYRHSVSATLTPLSVSIGTPEPGVWALMLVGFGGVGAALRTARRRRFGAAAA